MRVGAHPRVAQLMPDVALKAVKRPLTPSLLVEVCSLHLSTSRGHTAVWVSPQARIPPIIHFM